MTEAFPNARRGVNTKTALGYPAISAMVLVRILGPASRHSTRASADDFAGAGPMGLSVLSVRRTKRAKELGGAASHSRGNAEATRPPENGRDAELRSQLAKAVAARNPQTDRGRPRPSGST
jgi:hypothetical protein